QDPLLVQVLRPLQLDPGVGELRLGLGHRGLGAPQLGRPLVALGDEGLLLQAEEGLAGRDPVALLDEQLVDLAHHVGRDIDLLLGVDGAARLDHLRDVAALRLLGVHLDPLLPVAGPDAGEDDAGEDEDADGDEQGFLQRPPRACVPRRTRPTAMPMSRSPRRRTTAAAVPLPTLATRWKPTIDRARDQKVKRSQLVSRVRRAGPASGARKERFECRSPAPWISFIEIWLRDRTTGTARRAESARGMPAWKATARLRR